MNTYVIAHSDSPTIDSPVFHAGPDGQQEAVAVFTDRQRARQFLSQKQWEPQYEVTELSSTRLMQWLTQAHQDGVDMLVVDPDHEQQEEGEKQKVIFLDKPLEAFADFVRTEVFGEGSGAGGPASEQMQEQSAQGDTAPDRPPHRRERPLKDAAPEPAGDNDVPVR